MVFQEQIESVLEVSEDFPREDQIGQEMSQPKEEAHKDRPNRISPPPSVRDYADHLFIYGEYQNYKIQQPNNHSCCLQKPVLFGKIAFFCIQSSIIQLEVIVLILLTMLNKSERQIQFMLKQRQKIIDELKNNLQQTTLDTHNDTFASIDKHLNQYNEIHSIVQTINNSTINQQTAKLSYSKFWALNENIEREVQEKLRQLKEMDLQIENILNDEFDLSNQIEQIEEDIRSILSRKQPHHIEKAQPLLAQKNRHLQNLHTLKQQKQKLKSAKLSTIKELLKMLQKLRAHRESRLSSCNSKKLTAEALTILNAFIKDLRQVAQQKDKTEQSEINLNKLAEALETINERIAKVQNELLKLFSQQETIINTMQDIKDYNLESEYFEQQLYNKLQLQPTDLAQFLERSSLYINSEQQRKRQHEQLLQGIETTNETIKIFRHIHESIENQNRRKGELLKKLQLLQKEHEKQTAIQQQINDLQTELEKIEIKEQRLLKKLATTVDQADVNAYKSVDEELQGLRSESQAKEAIVRRMKDEMSEKAKNLFIETSLINQDFRDILSEVVPQIWFKDHDFSKEQTIRDLNLYLIKSFNRLNAKE